MSYISIRHAKSNELLRIKYITKLAYKIPYKENTRTTKPHKSNNIKSIFFKKEFFIIVAVLDGKIVGAIRYKFPEENSLYFYKLAVLKKYRNKGIGSLLVNKIEVVAKKKGLTKILFECMQEKRLPEYYKKPGYRIDEIKQHQSHHDVYMSKKIKI